MRKLISILVVAALALGLVPASLAMAAETGTSSGSFSVGGTAPHIDAFETYSDAACTLVANSLTPQVIYYAKISVSDANTLDDIQEIKVKSYYDATQADADESTIVAGAAQTAAIFTWTKAGGWTIAAGAPTTWTVETASSVNPTMTATTGDWIMAFKVGKVATEPVGVANWDFHAKVTDGTFLAHGIYLRGKLVLWYGQITVNTANIDFGTVNVATGFADNVNEVSSISVLCHSNGDFYGQVKSSATWRGSANNATLDSTGACANANEFSLKVYYNDTFASATQVDTTGVNVAPQSQTTEAGLLHDTLTLWLKLGAVFPIDAYSGSITFMIANR